MNANLPATSGKVNYFNFFYNVLNHHYSQHCYEPIPVLSVKEFMKSLDKNQFVLKMIVQKDTFINQKFPPHCHIHFDDNRFLVNNCRVSTKEYLFIIDGTTESGHDVKLWGEQHFELLKNTEPCEETITEFEKLKQQIDGEKCINLNNLHTVFLVVYKKTAVELPEN